eukprot:scaffold114170_cov66-Phaeocystis_antarctica.AAC.1
MVRSQAGLTLTLTLTLNLNLTLTLTLPDPDPNPNQVRGVCGGRARPRRGARATRALQGVEGTVR